MDVLNDKIVIYLNEEEAERLLLEFPFWRKDAIEGHPTMYAMSQAIAKELRRREGGNDE